MQTLSTALSMLGLAIAIVSMLLRGKNMKLILALVCICNLTMAISYLLVQQTSGFFCCVIGAASALINGILEYRSKPLPRWLPIVYAALFIIANLAVYSSPADLLALAGSLTFVMSVVQPNGKGYRIWSLANSACWLAFDIFTASYGQLITHGVLAVFTVVGMLLHDRKTKQQA